MALNVLLIYAVKSGKNLGKEKNIYLKSKSSFPFEIWIFRRGQPNRDVDHILFLVMNLI
jgi:hypothetical protein